MAEKRPLGVSILAAILLFSSPLLLVLGSVAAVRSTVRMLRENLGAYGIIMVLLSIGVVILGVVCAKSGLGLWRLKMSARAPTMFLMCMTAVFAFVQASVGLEDRTDFGWSWILGWASACVLSVWTVVYLCLPRTRRRFEPDLADNRREQR